jgi:hypothetical protein
MDLGFGGITFVKVHARFLQLSLYHYILFEFYTFVYLTVFSLFVSHTDGRLYTATPVDPVFIVLPIFEEARMKCNYNLWWFRSEMIRPLWVAGPIWLCDKNNYP